MELNHELIKEIYQGTSDLKNELKRCLRQPQDKKPEELTIPGNCRQPLRLSTGVLETGWVPSAVREGTSCSGALGLELQMLKDHCPHLGGGGQSSPHPETVAILPKVSFVARCYEGPFWIGFYLV